MERIYRGISPYDESGEFRFAGRASETLQLYERILRNDYTVYYAASGEGKSSLIRAGLLPILRRRGMFPVYIVFQDEDFVTAGCYTDVLMSRLEEELRRHSEVQLSYSWEDVCDEEDKLMPEQIEVLLEDPWWRLRNMRFAMDGAPLTPLFIFDQFEEVFTKAQYEWTDGYFAWLERISANYPPVEIVSHLEEWDRDSELIAEKCFKFLFSFRTEYLGDLDYWGIQKHYIPALLENRVCLKPMTPEGAMQVIALNDSVLGSHAGQIIAGCSEGTANSENNYPCVSALTLSVVCSVISEMDEDERNVILSQLVSDQVQTVDKILLLFYINKLSSAGLNLTRDAFIIGQIEDAFLDENGRRKRRSCDEPEIISIATWVEKLSLRENGLLKVIGHKYTEGHAINIVEFPHDRLCRAIDGSRKERREREAEKMNRQTEWTQFGLVTIIMMLIAFLWSSQMESIKNVIDFVLYDALYHPDKLIEDFLSTFHSYWCGEDAVFMDLSLNTGYSTLFGMILMVIILPSLVMGLARKGLSWRIVSCISAFLGTLFFGLLWHGSRSMEFDSPYVTVIIAASFIICAIVLLYLVINFISDIRKRQPLNPSEPSNLSMWPLWGGYFLFLGYLFYEFLTRTTFGISGPADSVWALIVLPLVYFMWAWGFFRMRCPSEKRKRRQALLYFFLCLAALILILLIAYTPPVNIIYGNHTFPYTAKPVLFKRLYGFPLSVLFIAAFILFISLSVRHIDSRSSFFIFSNIKKRVAICGATIVLLITYILNLGYNPLAISPSSVCSVYSWRTVAVTEKGNPLSVSPFGVLDATNGDTILPCVMIQDSMVLKRRNASRAAYLGEVQVKRAFNENPLWDKHRNATIDNSFIWVPDSGIGYGSFYYVPTLEQYIISIEPGNSIRDSINYCAAKFFSKLRLSSVRYLEFGDIYTIESLQPELDILDSLQKISFQRELDGLKNKADIYKLVDSELVSLFRELSRSFLICSIKDRIINGDLPSVFSHFLDYYSVFFSKIEGFGVSLGFSNSLTINNQKISSPHTVYLQHDEFNSKSAYPWYEQFRFLCAKDISYNVSRYEQNTAQLMELLHKKSEELSNKIRNTSVYDIESIEQLIHEYDLVPGFSGGIEMEKTFEMLITETFDGLIYLLNENYDGIYNNAFYKICEDLLSVALFRGYDIKKIKGRLEEYYKNQGAMLDYVSTMEDVDNEKDEFIAKSMEIINTKKKLNRTLDSLLRAIKTKEIEKMAAAAN